MIAAIVSDTHLPRGTRAMPSAALGVMRRADAILHAGDFTTPQVLADLRALGPPVHGVFGNVDTAELRAALPERAVVELAGATIGIVHIPGPARGRFERLRRAFPDTDAVVFGHTHMPEHEERDGFQIFNPGSPTERRRAPRHTIGLARIAAGRVAFELVDVSPSP